MRPTSLDRSTTFRRRLSFGAEIINPELVHFRVWAPAVHRVRLVLARGDRIPMVRDEHGYFSAEVSAKAGARYGLHLDDDERIYPDPASRFQPEGPHGLSEVVDPSRFEWTDRGWVGVAPKDRVLYEMHVGTFTPEGTWEAAIRELPALAALGITIVELMPVAEFDGRFGWGYDGVNLYAPFHHYGTPDDLRRFVDRAHALRLGVILDVVYNHFGPSGNYLHRFAPAFFTDRYQNEWGAAINFDGEGSGEVRRFFVENAGYWIDEFHVDGLRLDATQQIFDRSPVNVMREIATRVRGRAVGRETIVVAENEVQDTRLVRDPAAGGFGLDALWNDDFHHSAMVAVTGRREAYYSDTRGTPQEFISALKYGYLFQGQHYHWQRQPRGTPALDLEPARFVIFTQNHDQVANSARGLRGHELAHPGDWRALTALLLLAPAVPMLFQGQEFSASAPFLYFADLGPELAEPVRKGRAEFLRQFPSLRAIEALPMDDPGDPETFARSKLDLRERDTHGSILALHRDLLGLRRDVPAFRRQTRGALDGAVLGARAFVLRFFDDEPSGDRLVIVNLGSDMRRTSLAEPLIAPPGGCQWQTEWSSEDPRYGGAGAAPLTRHGRWGIPGHSATVARAAGILRDHPRPSPRKRRTA